MKACAHSLRDVAERCFSREEIKTKYPIWSYLGTQLWSCLRGYWESLVTLFAGLSRRSHVRWLRINPGTEPYGGNTIFINITWSVLHWHFTCMSQSLAQVSPKTGEGTCRHLRFSSDLQRVWRKLETVGALFLNCKAWKSERVMPGSL